MDDALGHAQVGSSVKERAKQRAYNNCTVIGESRKTRTGLLPHLLKRKCVSTSCMQAIHLALARTKTQDSGHIH